MKKHKEALPGGELEALEKSWRDHVEGRAVMPQSDVWDVAKKVVELSRRRVNLRKILGDLQQRKDLLVGAGLAIQHREGIDTTREQMEAAYDKINVDRPEGVK